MRAANSAHFISLHLIILRISGTEENYIIYTNCTYFYKLYNLLHSFVNSSLMSPNVPLDTLFSDTVSLCSSLRARDQVPHTYEATGSDIPYL